MGSWSTTRSDTRPSSESTLSRATARMASRRMRESSATRDRCKSRIGAGWLIASGISHRARSTKGTSWGSSVKSLSGLRASGPNPSARVNTAAIRLSSDAERSAAKRFSCSGTEVAQPRWRSSRCAASRRRWLSLAIIPISSSSV